MNTLDLVLEGSSRGLGLGDAAIASSTETGTPGPLKINF